MTDTAFVDSAQREILWNVSTLANQIALYALFGASLAICAWGVWSRICLWSGGVADSSRFENYGKRFLLLWEYVLKQRATVRSQSARLFHSLILAGFIALLFTTTMVFIHHDLGIPIYQGTFYLGVTVLSDLLGFLLLVGVCLAIHRRYAVQPDFLHNTPGALLVLLFLALMVAQGFGLEALRIHATSDPWAVYSPIGYALSLLFWGLNTEATRALHWLLWWFHSVTVFFFIAIIPYTKFFHIIASSLNLFFTRLDRAKGALGNPGDIDQLMEIAAESNGEFNIGVTSVKDLSWKQRLDLDACTECGRCQDICPAYNSGKALSPKWLILDTRNHLLALQAKGKLQHKTLPGTRFLQQIDQFLLSHLFLPMMDGSSKAVSSADARSLRAANPLVQSAPMAIGASVDSPLAGGVMNEDVFWSCTTCRACMEVCPVNIEHVDLIVDVRRSMALLEGNIPTEAQGSLRAIETRGNPFGPAESRADWTAGLSVPVLHAGDAVELLYWVGCISAFDKRKQRIARSLTTILNASGLSWGILGNRESCTGDPARRLGEENLFQCQAKKNIATLSELTFNSVVTNCPHCFNTLKNEYPAVGDPFGGRSVEVIHHTQFISRLIRQGRISVALREEELTFHDPCYLGRYNDVYEEPRDVLLQIGSRVSEMNANRERGMCCGAGGGHFWMDMKVGERINVQRITQARELKVETVATACPFCMHMLEDGVKLTDEGAPLEVRDIAELVASQLIVSQQH